MNSGIEPSITIAETISARDEQRWDVWAWLTLAAGLALVLVPLLTSLVGMPYPSDGWSSTSNGSGGNGFVVTGPYRMTHNDTNQPSLLQEEDIVLALEAFAATVRNETDLDALTAELLRVIQQTMEPEFLSIWLRDPVAEGRTMQGAPEMVRQSHD